MGLKECNIVLDNDWNTYYPGQTVNGRVDYTFDSPKKIRGICIKFRGEAETHWETTEQRQNTEGNNVNTTVPYSAKEEYFNISYYLLGNKSSNEIELPVGTHSFPFTCALPPTLPSSFEGEFGYIRYTIKVILDRPWKFDQETKMAFTIVSHMDLNVVPSCKEPMRIHIEKNFCCCWCKSGPLVVDVELPVSGYCSGQTMPIDISVENGSNVDVNSIRMKLVKVVRFRCHTPSYETKESKILIAEVDSESISANTTYNSQKILEIPPLPPSTLLNCGIIDLDYLLEMVCDVSGCHFNMEETRTITIGTVPLVGYQPPPPAGHTISILPDVPNQNNSEIPLMPNPAYPQYPADPNNAMPSAPVADNVVNPNVMYPALAQPVFQEGQFNARTIHDANDSKYMTISGQQNFAPRYPVYGFVIPK